MGGRQRRDGSPALGSAARIRAQRRTRQCGGAALDARDRLHALSGGGCVDGEARGRATRAATSGRPLRAAWACAARARLRRGSRGHSQGLDGRPPGRPAGIQRARESGRRPEGERPRTERRRLAGRIRRRHGDAPRPGRRHQQRAATKVGRSSPPDRSAHRAPVPERAGRGVGRRRHGLRRRGGRQDRPPARARAGHSVLRGPCASLVVELMTIDQFFWVLSRVAGLGSYAALAVALVTGIALRTAVLDWLGSNRALRSLHEYTTVLWIPLALLHLGALVLDRTSRISLIDLVLPFHSSYGTLAIGLGTLAVDLLLVVTATAWLKRRMNKTAWQWLHRLAYVAFALIFFHAVLSGTDFSDPAVSAITWAAAAALSALGLTRVFWGRLPA